MGGRLRLAASALVLSSALCMPSVPLHAVDLRDVLTGYSYTTWSRKDGLTGPVWAVAQDANGFLWLGTDAALIRFDGVRFMSWESLGGQPLPRLPVRALHVARDGTMWIGFGGSGGLARIQDRTVTAYVSPSGSDTTGIVSLLLEDQSGGVWAAAAEGLFQFTGERWQRVGAEAGLPGSGAATAYADRAGTLWVDTPEGLYRRTAAAAGPFELVEPADDSPAPSAMSDDAEGRLWVTDPVSGFRPLRGSAAPRPTTVQAGRGYRLLLARDGSLWVATIGQGLWRAKVDPARPGRLNVERTTLLSGLSSDAVRTVFEDRDGNIWAGTTEGVDRLVPHRITPWTGLGVVTTIDRAHDGRIWAGTPDELIPFARRGGSWQPEPLRLPLRGVVALRGTTSGVWVTTASGLYRVDTAAVRPVPAVRPPTPFSIEALAVDLDGEAWVIAGGGEVLRTEGGQLRPFAQVDALAAGRASAALVDRKGHLWVAYGTNRIGVLVAPDDFRPVDVAGAGNGPHYDLFEDRTGTIWLCSADGFGRLEGDRFVLAGRHNGLPSGGASAVTEDARGQLWMATSVGLIRLERDEFDRVLSDARYAMRFHVYDTSDGLAGYPVTLADRNAVRADDGTLWFVTSRGISVADPLELRAERPSPLVAIDAVRVDDVPLEGTEAPPGSSKIEIDFTAPELTSPLKTRFRYRLEGFDVDWVDAGTRRQALYTGLPPREYTFRVAVNQDDGRWSEVEASFSFALRPRFYQTWWFAIVTLASVAGITWGAWRIRVRQLRSQFALVLGERVRLSRELHDTLLQSLVGVALEFDAVSKALDNSPSTARERVIKIREQVEEYIRDARRSIWSLRSPALETGDLIEALREAGTRATAGRGVPFTFEQSGPVRRLSSNIEHQLLRIGQEALLNAARHAQATAIAMRLHYTDDAVTLTIVDNGRGFDPARAAEGTTDHYGLTTMRERAQQAGGRLTITSSPGQGTTVEAIVPVTAGSEGDGD